MVLTKSTPNSTHYFQSFLIVSVYEAPSTHDATLTHGNFQSFLIVSKIVIDAGVWPAIMNFQSFLIVSSPEGVRNMDKLSEAFSLFLLFRYAPVHVREEESSSFQSFLIVS